MKRTALILNNHKYYKETSVILTRVTIPITLMTSLSRLNSILDKPEKEIKWAEIAKTSQNTAKRNHVKQLGHNKGWLRICNSEVPEKECRLGQFQRDKDNIFLELKKHPFFT